MRIMIIDDHEISRAACCALLRTEGIDVVGAAADDEAIAAAATLRPDAAIVDVTPTVGSGLDIARRLRAQPDQPAVVLTSSADPTRFGSQLDGYLFIAKADICSTAIGGLFNHRERARPDQ